METQARIPSALAALHNFILTHDASDLATYEDDIDNQPGQRPSEDIDFGNLAEGFTTRQEKRRAEKIRDQIAKEMWADYQRELASRRATAMDVDHDIPMMDLD